MTTQTLYLVEAYSIIQLRLEIPFPSLTQPPNQELDCTFPSLQTANREYDEHFILTSS